MNNVLARNIIREEILPIYMKAYVKSDKKGNTEKVTKYEDIIDALYTALDEMEQCEEFRAAINEFRI